MEFVCGVSVGEKAMSHFLSSFVIPDSLALSWLSGVCVCGVSIGEKAMSHFLSSFVIPDSLVLS